MYFSNKSNYCINGRHIKAFKVPENTRKIAGSCNGEKEKAGPFLALP
jgi:hypothetical protein